MCLLTYVNWHGIKLGINVSLLATGAHIVSLLATGSHIVSLIATGSHSVSLIATGAHNVLSASGACWHLWLRVS